MCFLVYVLLHAVFIAATEDVVSGLRGGLGWAIWICLCFYFVKGDPSSSKHILLGTFIFTGAINAVSLLIEHSFGIQIQPTTSTLPFTLFPDYIYRSEGIGINNGVSSTQLMIGAIVCVYYLNHDSLKNNTVKLVAYSAYGLILMGLWLSTIRGAILSFAIGFLLLMLLSKDNLREKVSILIFTLVITVLTIEIFFANHFLNYLGFILQAMTPNDPGNLHRLEVWNDLLNESSLTVDPLGEKIILLKNDSFGWFSLFGRGAGSLSYVTPHIGSTQAIESSYLRLWLELGFIGAFVFLVMIVALLKKLATRTSVYRCDRVFFLVLFLMINFRAAHNDVLQTWLGGFYYWSIIALCVGLVNRSGECQPNLKQG